MDRSPSPPRRTRSAFTGAALRTHLQNLMEQKSTQLQTLGTMGQEILKQQQELEERIKGFEAEEEEEVGEETQSRLKDLDADMRSWEEQNEDMMRGLGAKVSPPTYRSIANRQNLDFTSTVPAPPSSLSRRQRNAQHRTLDMEFATEIGQNLLVEVRRLQALLSERDRALEKFSDEKDSWESERNGMLAAVRTAEGNVGK